MACNHCKANVEKAIGSVPGVETVEVDLAKGIAYVTGRHDAALLVEAVGNIGFEASPMS
jgi:copper chaperone CopZ